MGSTAGWTVCLQAMCVVRPSQLHYNRQISQLQVARRHARGGGTSMAHLLLHDPQLRVRHAAAATIATLLEGSAQRAYLAVAEARELDRQPVRCGACTLGDHLVCVLEVEQGEERQG